MEQTAKPATLEVDEARRGLREAMLTMGPDFVYNPNGDSYKCQYQPAEAGTYSDLLDRPLTEDDAAVKTGCLIGTLFTNRGNAEHLSSGLTVSALQGDNPHMMTEDAARYLKRAQDYQDQGYSWGRAYEEAEAAYMAADLPIQGFNPHSNLYLD